MYLVDTKTFTLNQKAKSLPKVWHFGLVFISLSIILDIDGAMVLAQNITPTPINC